MNEKLALIATSLEGHAGASTVANANENGYWKRIAAALEALAGATTEANPTRAGYMLRAALAAESIAGTSGAEENANEAGYAKRIVDALEVQSGDVTEGSYLQRMMVAAENAVFGEALGPELVTNGDASSGTGWTTGDYWSVTGGQFVRDGTPGDADSLLRTAASEIVPGTVRTTFTLVAISGGSVRAIIGGGLGTPRSAPGTYTEDIVTAAASQLVGIVASFDNTSVTTDNISAQQVL